MGRLKAARASSARRRGASAALSTDERIVASAIELLDTGGEDAVTLRAVALASGVSHNAPYKHFDSRDALLGAIAVRDFRALQHAFERAAASGGKPLDNLLRALHHTVEFSHKHPARYGLLFGNAYIAAAPGEVKASAVGCFGAFVTLVSACRRTGKLASVPPMTVASLLFATMHGLVSMQTVGGLHPEKGLTGVESTMHLLIELVGL